MEAYLFTLSLLRRGKQDEFSHASFWIGSSEFILLGSSIESSKPPKSILKSQLSIRDRSSFENQSILYQGFLVDPCLGLLQSFCISNIHLAAKKKKRNDGLSEKTARNNNTIAL